MVIVAPMYEEDAQASGIYYNTAAVIDADGTYSASTARRNIPREGSPGRSSTSGRGTSGIRSSRPP